MVASTLELCRSRGGILGIALPLELFANRRLDLLFFRIAQAAPGTLQCLALDGREHAGGLLAAHHRRACIRPLKQEPRAVSAAAHGVIAGAEAAADDHGIF